MAKIRPLSAILERASGHEALCQAGGRISSGPKECASAPTCPQAEATNAGTLA
jgi:hypothetical protein